MSSRLEPAIEFAGVHYRFDGHRELIRNLTLQIVPGDTLMLLGRSGSGKTTTLKLINRLLAPSAGEIRVDGVPAMQWDPIKLRRHIGYAIQDVGLFPHYTVEQNIAVVPKLEHWEASRINKRVQEVMQLVGLPPDQFAQRYPDQLSGGQKQRVGLARALAADPPILLMDEPFGALDPITRAGVQMEFKHLQHKLAKTVVFVTHDVGEALLLGTRIAVMEEGTLRGIYTPAEFLKSSDQFAKLYVDTFRASQETLQL